METTKLCVSGRVSGFGAVCRGVTERALGSYEQVHGPWPQKMCRSWLPGWRELGMPAGGPRLVRAPPLPPTLLPASPFSSFPVPLSASPHLCRVLPCVCLCVHAWPAGPDGQMPWEGVGLTLLLSCLTRVCVTRVLWTPTFFPK